VKRAEIEHYISTVEGLLVSSAHNIAVIEAAMEFTEAFDEYERLAPADNTSLRACYHDAFAPKYLESTGKNPPVERILATLSGNAKALQSAYISKNSHPLGEKDGLHQAPNDTLYDEIHGRFHSSVRKVLQGFGLYDIFIVSPESGAVVYSTYKELDFATSLNTGP